MVGDRLHRCTFSRSLAEYLSRLLPGSEVVRIQLTVGRELVRGESSQTGAYALLSRTKGTILRVQLHREVAELLCDYDSRAIHEVGIVAQR